MKIFVYLLFVIFVLFSSLSFAADLTIKDNNGNTLYSYTFTKSNEKGIFIEVKDEKLRVLPCGEVSRMTWKELIPNQARRPLTFSPTSSLNSVVYIQE